MLIYFTLYLGSFLLEPKCTTILKSLLHFFIFCSYVTHEVVASGKRRLAITPTNFCLLLPRVSLVVLYSNRVTEQD